MRINRFIVVLFLFFISCQTNDKDESNVSEDKIKQKQKQKKTLNNEEVPFLALSIDANPVEMKDIEEELQGNSFGKFFHKNAEFFIIDNPKNRVYNSKVSSIRLYYLYEKLCQTKYFLEEDITNRLINKFGQFKITGFDFDNRDEIENGKIVSKINGEWRLREEFTNYRLSWEIGDKEILLRVNKYDPGEPYVYIERVADYKDLFRSLEYSD